VDAVIQSLPDYWVGFRKTLELTLLSAVFALALGTVLAGFRVAPVAPLRWFGTGYVDTIRNTPLTILFAFLVFVAPQIGFRVPFETSAIIALSVYTAAFVCEAVRSGINSVGVGQAEASRALGFTFRQTMGLIVLPQALRTVVPPLINIFIALAKNSSVAGGFFVVELFGIGKQLTNDFPADVIPVLIGVGVAYLIITIPSGLLAGYVERKVVFAR
jgi:glutamate transport system permease protein